MKVKDLIGYYDKKMHQNNKNIGTLRDMQKELIPNLDGSKSAIAYNIEELIDTLVEHGEFLYDEWYHYQEGVLCGAYEENEEV